MFSNKSVRNSFSLFDLDNKNKNSTKNEHKSTSTHDSHLGKTTKLTSTSKKKELSKEKPKLDFPRTSSKQSNKKEKLPLARSPLLNFKSDFEQTRNISDLSSFGSAKSIDNSGTDKNNIMNNAKSTTSKNILNTSTNPPPSNLNLQPTSQIPRQRRPPPPKLDMESIRRSVLIEKDELNLSDNHVIETNQHNNENTDNSLALEGTQSITTIGTHIDEELNNNKHKELNNNKHKESEHSSQREHTRQRSQAESLVDDLDIFIQEYKEKSKSLEDIFASGSDDNGDVNGKIVNDSRSLESSLLYITPLDVKGSNHNLNVKNNDNEFEGTTEFSRQTLTIANLSSHDVQEINELKNDSNSNSDSDSSESNFSFSRSIKHSSLNDSAKYDINEPLPLMNDINADKVPIRKQTNPFFNYDEVNAKNSSLNDLTGTGKDNDYRINNKFIPDEQIHSEDLINEIFNNDSSKPKIDEFSDHQEINAIPQDETDMSSTDMFSNKITKDNIPTNDHNTINENKYSIHQDDNAYSDGSSSSSDEMIIRNEEPRRTFRVVNEDHPTFFLQSDVHSMNRNSDSYTDENISSELNHNEVTSISYQDNSDKSLISDFSNKISLPHDSVENLINGTTVLPSRSIDNVRTTSHDTDQVLSLASSKTSLGTFGENNRSQTTIDSSSRSNERSTKLVSGYVEELRLKYYKTSNFLEAPPNLPMILKQKNNLIQPKNIKVKIRTNTKQIGIKHGKVKQKLLALETNNEKNVEKNHKQNRNSIANVDHSKEFHNFFNKDGSENNDQNLDGDEDSNYLNDIPGDDAYDSDDILAPLREKKGSHDISRSDTVVSYYTKSQNLLKNKAFLENAPALPTHIIKESNKDGENSNKRAMRSASINTVNSQYISKKISGSLGLHIANPDSDTD